LTQQFEKCVVYGSFIIAYITTLFLTATVAHGRELPNQSLSKGFGSFYDVCYSIGFAKQLS
jgi:hypothetical protein